MSEYNLSYTGAEVNELLSTVNDNHDAWDSISHAVDYIIDQGSSGCCDYDKYASGRCRIWGRVNNADMTNITESCRGVEVALPFPIVELESALASTVSSAAYTKYGDLGAAIRGISDSVASFQVVVGWTANASDMEADFEIVGRWK